MTALALPCLGDQLDDVRRNASVLVLAAVGYGRASCVPASPVPQRWLDGPVRGVRRVPQRGKPEGMTWWKEKPAADSNDEQCDVEAVCGSEERVVDDVWDGGDGSTERQMRFGHCRVTRQPITERESDNCGTEADWPGAGRVHLNHNLPFPRCCWPCLRPKSRRRRNLQRCPCRVCLARFISALLIYLLFCFRLARDPADVHETTV